MTLQHSSRDLALTDDWVPIAEAVAELAVRIAGTDLVPKAYRNQPEQVAAIILRGRELGLPPMTALASCYSINGTVGLKAEAMRAMILAAGHHIWFTDATGVSCTCKGQRLGSEHVHSVTWTMDMATQAGLVSRNPQYRTFPRNMLKARATVDMARDLFPDVIGGMAGAEELADMGPEPSQRQPRKRIEPAPQALPPELDTAPPSWDAPSTSPEAPESSAEREPMSADQRGYLFALAADLGYSARDARLAVTSQILGRDVGSWSELTMADASTVIDVWQEVLAEPFTEPDSTGLEDDPQGDTQ